MLLTGDAAYSLRALFAGSRGRLAQAAVATGPSGIR